MPVAYSLRGVVELVVETNNMSAKMLELWPGFGSKAFWQQKALVGWQSENCHVKQGLVRL
jgi:hypothetical protein